MRTISKLILSLAIFNASAFSAGRYHYWMQNAAAGIRYTRPFDTDRTVDRRVGQRHDTGSARVHPRD